MDKQKLVDAVIEEIKKDFYNNDWDAIDGLLYNVDSKLLQDFLRLNESKRRKQQFEASRSR